MKLTDQVRKSLTCTAAAMGNIVAHGLDLRVPTTNQVTTAEFRKMVEDQLQPGDVILTSDTSYLLWEGIEYSVAGSHYTHVSIYEGNGRVLEATVDSGVDGVMRSMLDGLLSGPIKVAIIRPAYVSEADREHALEFCRSKLGKRYDGLFNMDTADGASYYCSSLLYAAFASMPNPITVERKRRLGRWLVIPDAFLHLDGHTVVYRDRFSFWSSLKGGSPTMLGGAAATVGFHLMLAHLAPVAGFYLAISAGNKLQTGHFGLTSGPAKVGRMDQASA